MPLRQCVLSLPMKIYANDERTGNCLLIKGINKNYPNSVILIEQAEQGKSIDMFKDPAVRQLIEEAAYIY